MENVNELENFRERWRNELVCRDEQMARNEEDLDDAESVLRHADVDDGDDVTKKRKIGFAKRTSNYYMAEEGDLDDCLPYYPKTDPVVGEAVSIANDLLKGTYVKRKLSESDEHTNKDGKIDKETKKTRTLEAKGRTNANLLDTLIADLNEINEIPFFDIALPRELAMKIFEHFEMSDLLSCAQVSVSWRSLADDDILWCRICHRLGYLMNIHAGEKSSWKEAVRECITEDKSLRSNWKGRIGCMSTLEYVRGGILTSAQSYQDAIIAGYTNGRVRLWNINDIESDLFVTSHETIGLEQRCRPAVDHVATNSNIAMATYDNGDVDVWNLKDTSTPTYHFHCDENIQSVAMAADGTAIATAVGYTVRIEVADSNGSWKCSCKPRTAKPVGFMKFIPQNTSSSEKHIIMATDSKMMGGIYQYRISPSWDTAMVTLHQLTSPATCLDVDDSLIACGIGSSGFQEGFTVKMFNTENGGIVQTLHGHSWDVSCLNLIDSPPYMLVTGCKDKKVRVYDFRDGCYPVMSVRGHGGTVTAVQMDEWKVVSGGKEGMLCVWDIRMKTKLWETYARHPIRHLHFDKTTMISTHIPEVGVNEDNDDFDIVVHKRQRGEIRVYNFLSDQTTEGLPSVCLSTYDEPEGYNYNIRLTVPYDDV